MPLPNRVSPFGELFATPARGTLMGNRGGRIHTDDRKLTSRRWASRQWICCVLDFKDRQRDVWGRYYTELFFLDEVAAFAAGHRPCFECRRKDAERFAALFPAAATNSSAHSRALAAAKPKRLRFGEAGSGNPALVPRFRGDERRRMGRASAQAMDNVLHGERLDGKAKRLHRRALKGLPDGAMIARDGEAFAVRGSHLLRWAPSGYDRVIQRPRGIDADVLTPPAILNVLAAGYVPQWHGSLAALTA